MTKKEFLKREIQWLVEEKYNGILTKDAKKDIEKLKKGEPLAYLIGFVDFLGSKIRLEQRPLIPRSETEYWAEVALKDIQQHSSPLQILDVFAGSGCIGIAILKNTRNTKVDFSELDIKAFRQIKTNLASNHINSSRFRLFRSDIFSALPSQQRYDYILANPPYLSESKKSLIQSSVIKYEPHKALFAGKDGLLAIKRFLKEAPTHLTKRGKIYMEFDSWQKKKIQQILRTYRYQAWKFYRDQYKKWRFLIASPNYLENL